MDTAETYIKMCDCEEIQGHFKGKPWDCSMVADMRTHDISIYLAEYHRNGDQWKYILLPHQNQLQEMFDKNAFRCHFFFNDFLYEHILVEPEDGLSSAYPPPDKENWSMEQLWLAFVMKEKYGKTWDGDKWVKIELV